jgi:ribosome-binding protein aMBF1 (putative translation factor)
MIIYKTTNLVNGKFYIGKDSKNNHNYLGSGKILKQAIKKYGKTNFRKEILEECFSMEDLNEQEKYWIKTLNSRDLSIGYNIREGGDNNPIKDIELRNEKLSKALTGRAFSKEHRENIKKNHHDVKGENNPMFGKKHSDEVKEYSRKLNTGRKPTKLQRAKMREQNRGENNNRVKLTEEHVLLIRKLYFEDNILQKELAQRFNVQEACIFKICSYRTWKHI